MQLAPLLTSISFLVLNFIVLPQCADESKMRVHSTGVMSLLVTALLLLLCSPGFVCFSVAVKADVWCTWTLRSSSGCETPPDDAVYEQPGWLGLERCQPRDLSTMPLQRGSQVSGAHFYTALTLTEGHHAAVGCHDPFDSSSESIGCKPGGWDWITQPSDLQLTSQWQLSYLKRSDIGIVHQCYAEFVRLHPSSALSIGAKIGIGVGAALAAVAIIAAIVCWRRRSRASAPAAASFAALTQPINQI